MDEEKFNAMRYAMSSLQTVVWMLIRIAERNGMSEQEAKTINTALRNYYHYYMRIAEGDSTEQIDTE